jgi:flavin-dependent dehydrogenase
LETARPSYLDRIPVAGDAAGQAKPTTGGGLYYGFIGSSAAAETIADAFSRGDFSSGFLKQYEQRWRKRIGLDLLAGRYFRHLTSRLSNAQNDFLLSALGKDGLAEILRKTADSDSHKRVILRFCRHLLFWKALHGL